MALIAEKKKAMIAHGMGCGKTKVVVDAILNLDLKRCLIVCPKTVIDVWPHEFTKHGFKEAQVVPLTKGTTKVKAQKASAELERAGYTNKNLVFVINYESVWLYDLGNFFATHDWDAIICDEIHRIKSPGGKCSRFMGRLGRRAQYRIGLTGTPLPHSPLDAFAQYRFLDREIFGTSYLLFRNEYAIMGGYRPDGAIQGVEILGYKNLDKLSEKMYSIGHRVTKKDVLPDLPKVTHQTHHVVMTDAESKAYSRMEHEFIAEVGKGVVTAANALAKLTRLQQITSGFAVVEREDRADPEITSIGNSKADALYQVIEGIEDHEPVVVFCRFHQDLDRVHKQAKKLGRQSFELSGRENRLDIWKKQLYHPGGGILAAQIQAGSEGVDLTAANYCIYYSLGFSLGQYEQSLARVDRPGQTKPVTYIHLVTDHSIDARIYGALKDKKDIVNSVLNGYGKDTH